MRLGLKVALTKDCQAALIELPFKMSEGKKFYDLKRLAFWQPVPHYGEMGVLNTVDQISLHGQLFEVKP